MSQSIGPFGKIHVKSAHSAYEEAETIGFSTRPDAKNPKIVVSTNERSRTRQMD
jgi:hypothetical protein